MQIRILLKSEKISERALSIVAGMIPKESAWAVEAEQILESNLSLTGAKAAVGVLWLIFLWMLIKVRSSHKRG